MRKLYTTVIAVIISAIAFAQAPNKMSYQAVIRNSSNQLVVSHSVGMRISILLGSPSGNAVYVETQTPTTNVNGLVTLEIGGGTVLSGAFDAIDWSNGTYFIKTETDPTGGTNYSITGTSQLLSVPYALYAKNAGNGFSGSYNDLTNKPILFDGNYNSLSNKPIFNVSKTGDTLTMGNGNWVIIPGISAVNLTLNSTPWQISDSVQVKSRIGHYTCNNNYVIFSNFANDSLFVFDIAKRQIIDSKKFSTIGSFVAKEKVIIIPTGVHSFEAYDISNIKNWTLISTFTGLDEGILYWQFNSSPLSDNNYYWIGHWSQTVQIFTIINNTITEYNKFNVGVNSQGISRFNNSLFVASNYTSNKKFDISNPNSPINMGDFGNSHSDANSTSTTGLILQNLNGGWSGNIYDSNIKLYNQNNVQLDVLPFRAVGLAVPNGYCIINDDNIYKVYNIKNEKFEYITQIPRFSFAYNDKYLITRTEKAFYFINLDK